MTVVTGANYVTEGQGLSPIPWCFDVPYPLPTMFRSAARHTGILRCRAPLLTHVLRLCVTLAPRSQQWWRWNDSVRHNDAANRLSLAKREAPAEARLHLAGIPGREQHHVPAGLHSLLTHNSPCTRPDPCHRLGALPLSMSRHRCCKTHL